MENFNSLEWLKSQVQQEFDIKKEMRRKARNKRKAELRKRKKK